MSVTYVVLHKNHDSLTENTKIKLDEIIDENIKTHEEYFCCDDKNQICYFHGTLHHCQDFVSRQDQDVQECMKIIECKEPNA